MSDHIDHFRQAIEAAGLPAPAQIIDDGKLHRFSTNGKHGDDSGWYVLHGDGIAAASFGCWRSGLQSTWCAKPDHELSDPERKAVRERTKAMQRQREVEQLRMQTQARATAAARLAESVPADSHPYLSAKGIRPYGIRFRAGRLLIPMRDTEGTLHSLQSISADGSKRFLRGGRMRGCYFSIGKPDGVIIICEGLATGASIHECTEHAVAVAFNAGNLEPVAMALREKYPAIRIVIAADDDHATAGNPGLSKARQAAQAVGGVVAIPDFGRAA
jgi:putative DNA primase/helicase